MSVGIDLSAVLPQPKTPPEVQVEEYSDAQLVVLRDKIRQELIQREDARSKALAEEQARADKIRLKKVPRFIKRFKDLKARAKAFKKKVTVSIPIEFTFIIRHKEVNNLPLDDNLDFDVKLSKDYKGGGRSVVTSYLSQLCSEVGKIVPPEALKEFDSIRKDAVKFQEDIAKCDLKISDFE